MPFLSAPRFGSSTSKLSQNDYEDEDEDDEVSLSGLNNNDSTRRSHSRSSMLHHYGFSDDEDVGASSPRESSLHQHDVYVDSDDGMKGKKQKTKKRDSHRSRNLDALISPAPRKKKLNVKAAKTSPRSPQHDNSLSIDALISPTPGRKKKAKASYSHSSGLDARALEENLSSLDALLSPTPAKKKKSKGSLKLQAGDSLALEALLSPAQMRKKKVNRRAPRKKKKSLGDHLDTRKKSGVASTQSVSSGSMGSFYQVDADEYETATDDDDLELSDVQDLIEKRKQAKQALVEKALTLNRSSMKKSLSKKKEDLSLSNHSQKSPVRQRSNAKNNKSMDALSLSNHAKERAETARRNRRGSTKKDFFEGSTSNLDYKPKRSSSLRSKKKEMMDQSNHSTKSASKPPKKKNSEMDDDRSYKSAPKPSKKKSLEMDDDRSNKSAPTVRRKKKEIDRGSGHSPKRPSSIKKKKKERLDEYDDDSVEPVNRKSNSSKSRQRRLVKKKSSDITDDRSESSDSTLSSVSDTEMQLGALERAIASPRIASPRRPRPPPDNSKSPFRASSLRVRGERLSSTSSKSPFRSGSLRMTAATEGLNALSRKLNNLNLSSSDHGLRPKRTPRGNRDSAHVEEDERGAGKVRPSRVGRRNSNAA